MTAEGRSDWGLFALEHADDVVVVCDPRTMIRWASPGLPALLGWAPLTAEGLTWTFEGLPRSSAAASDLARALAAGRDRCDVRLHCRRADGTFAWIDAAVRLVRDGAGSLEYLVVSLHNPESVRESERAHLEAESRYQLLARNADNVVTWVDNDGIIRYASPSVRRALMRDPESLVGRPAISLFLDEDHAAIREAQEKVLAGEPASFEARALMPDGSSTRFAILLQPTYDDRGRLIGRSSGWRNMQAEHAARVALARETDYDALTGLAKRDVALARIGQILEARDGEGWALLCVGINGMSQINQAFTYAGGDEVLREVADRLVAAVVEGRRVARVAGDEFAVMLADLTTPTRAAETAEALLGAVRGPVNVGGENVEVSACIGIAMASGESPAELLSDATAAMRQAGARGPDRWDFLDGNVASRTRDLLRMQADLVQGLDHGEVRAWLMPIVSFATGQVCGYESLGRWVRPDGTVVKPDDFLRGAERTSVILRIDREILRQVVALLPALPPAVHVAVNLSGPTLTSGHLVEWIAEDLARHDVDPRRLHLEVTETSLFQVNAAIVGQMMALHEMGCTWWVDDFGTGYSSLAHLRDLPIGGVKLDKTYSAEVTDGDSRAARLAQGLCLLAQGLGLLSIAEGVETAEQAHLLAEQGWQMGQGYLYGRAVPIQDVVAEDVTTA